MTSKLLTLKALYTTLYENRSILFTSNAKSDFLTKMDAKGFLDLLFGKALKDLDDIIPINNYEKAATSSIYNGTLTQRSGASARSKEIFQALVDPNRLESVFEECKEHLGMGEVNKEGFVMVFTPLLTDYIFPGNLHTWLSSKLTEGYCSDFVAVLAIYALFPSRYESLLSLKNKTNNYLVDEKIHPEIIKHLDERNIKYLQQKHSDIIATIPQNNFNSIRRLIIERTAFDHLTLAGQSLNEAFDPSNQSNIINLLQTLIASRQIKSLDIFIMDPAVLSSPKENSPVLDLTKTRGTILSQICPECDKAKCELKVFFLPSCNVDHAVITKDYLIYRSTKLWTQKRDYKGNYYLCKRVPQLESRMNATSEYDAHKSYLELMKKLSKEIDPFNDLYEDIDDGAINYHQEWRKEIQYFQYTKLYKLYQSQIDNHVSNTWVVPHSMEMDFVPSAKIKSRQDLFDPKNLLNDKTQSVLLPYIKHTEKLLSRAVKQYSSDDDDSSGALIYPSLDLGFPNNVQRLAGGFATGMLVTWNCNIKFVPVDATVNVCTSSVFELDNFDTSRLKDDMKDQIDTAFDLASRKHGFSFSFDSGNHFLMIARNTKKNKVYLVLHSSANEFKNSYVGLYPVENNWYSKKIKLKQFGDPIRYLRYIKENDASFFIELAHQLETYNAQIHTWLATHLNNEKTPATQIVKHHYYMPTDSSIAIGTFVEKPGTLVPIFSDIRKPVYLFKIGNDNWKVNLPPLGQVCVIPHGWGQKIDDVTAIYPDLSKGELHLEPKYVFDINSESRIKIPSKTIRDYTDGHKFLKVGNRMIQGTIEETLHPLYLFCDKFKGKIVESSK